MELRLKGVLLRLDRLGLLFDGLCFLPCDIQFVLSSLCLGPRGGGLCLGLFNFFLSLRDQGQLSLLLFGSGLCPRLVGLGLRNGLLASDMHCLHFQQ